MKTSFRPFKEISKTTAEAQWEPYTAAARRFALDLALEADKKGEAHSCWDEIMLIFNIRRLNFTRYEARAKRLDLFDCISFLVVTYRELRLLDFDVVQAVRKRTGQLATNVDVKKNVFLTQLIELRVKSTIAAQTKPEIVQEWHQVTLWYTSIF